MTRHSIQNLVLLGCISAIAQAFNLTPSTSSSRSTIAFARQSCRSSFTTAAMPSFSIHKSSSLQMSTSAEEDVEEAADESSTTEEAVEVVEAVAEETEEVAEEAVEAVAEETPAPVVEEKKEEEGYTAYVVNIAYDTQNWQLRELFSTYGTVQRVFMPQNRETGKSKGIAFVTMSTPEELEASIADLNESEVDGRTMYVDKAKPKGAPGSGPKGGRRGQPKENEMKLYIGNLSYETTAEDLTEYFSEFGEVADVYIPLDRETGSSRGFGFCSMDKEAAQAAIDQSVGVSLQGREIQVNESVPKGQQPARKARGGGGGASGTKIYVGNVPFDTSEESVVELFEEYGPVVDFYMPIDRNFGRPRGFAFVTLAPDAAATAIEELDGYELDGRFLRVNEAQPKGSFTERNDYGNSGGDGFYDNSGDWGSDDGY